MWNEGMNKVFKGLRTDKTLNYNCGNKRDYPYKALACSGGTLHASYPTHRTRRRVGLAEILSQASHLRPWWDLPRAFSVAEPDYNQDALQARCNHGYQFLPGTHFEIEMNNE